MGCGGAKACQCGGDLRSTPVLPVEHAVPGKPDHTLLAPSRREAAWASVSPQLPGKQKAQVASPEDRRPEDALPGSLRFNTDAASTAEEGGEATLALQPVADSETAASPVTPAVHCFGVQTPGSQATTFVLAAALEAGDDATHPLPAPASILEVSTTLEQPLASSNAACTTATADAPVEKHATPPPAAPASAWSAGAKLEKRCVSSKSAAAAALDAQAISHIAEPGASTSPLELEEA